LVTFTSTYIQEIINMVMLQLSVWSNASTSVILSSQLSRQWFVTLINLRTKSLHFYIMMMSWHSSTSLDTSCTISAHVQTSLASQVHQSSVTLWNYQVKCSKTGCGKKKSWRVFRSMSRQVNHFLMNWLRKSLQSRTLMRHIPHWRSFFMEHLILSCIVLPIRSYSQSKRLTIHIPWLASEKTWSVTVLKLVLKSYGISFVLYSVSISNKRVPIHRHPSGIYLEGIRVSTTDTFGHKCSVATCLINSRRMVSWMQS